MKCRNGAAAPAQMSGLAAALLSKCKSSGCQRTSWNGRAGEFCSRACRDAWHPEVSVGWHEFMAAHSAAMLDHSQNGVSVKGACPWAWSCSCSSCTEYARGPLTDPIASGWHSLQSLFEPTASDKGGGHSTPGLMRLAPDVALRRAICTQLGSADPDLQSVWASLTQPTSKELSRREALGLLSRLFGSKVCLPTSPLPQFGRWDHQVFPICRWCTYVF